MRHGRATRIVRRGGAGWLAAVPVLLAGAVAAGELEVRFESAAVSVMARDVPLAEVIGEIARQAEIVLILDRPLPERTTQAFRELALGAAIRRLLGPRDFVLEYAARPGAPPRARRLHVLATTEAAAAPPALEADRRSRLATVASLTDEGGAAATRALAAAALNDADEAVRREAVHALGEIAGEAGIDTLGQALKDADPGVRTTAAAALADAGGEHAARALGTALADEDPDVREHVVDALGEIGGPTASTLLRRALADPDPVVREAAAENLAELTDAGS